MMNETCSTFLIQRPAIKLVRGRVKFLPALA